MIDATTQFYYRGIPFTMQGVNDQDHIFKQICRSQTFYEIELLEYMHSVVHRRQHSRSISIDVGANIGNHSTYFGKFLADIVIAIEPNPRVKPVLARNLRINGIEHVIYDCALGSEEGFGELVIPDGFAGNAGAATVKVSDCSRDQAHDQIRVATLDALFKDFNCERAACDEVSFIKVDVEGMEMDVLKGARETIARHTPHLFVEAMSSEHVARLRGYMGEIGYTEVSHWAATPVYHFAHRPTLRLLRDAYCHICRYRVRQSARALERRFRAISSWDI